MLGVFISLRSFTRAEIYTAEERKKMLKMAAEIPDEEKWKVNSFIFSSFFMLMSTWQKTSRVV